MDVSLLVTIGIGTMFILVTSFLLINFNAQKKKWQLQREMSQLKEQQQNQLIEAAVRSEEGERHRIAEMLHDEVGAMLSSSRIFLVEMNTDRLSAADRQDHGKVKEMLDESIQKVRSISHNLHSTILKEFGLNEAIRHFMKKISGGSVISIEVELTDDYKGSNPETDLAVYRINQELVNNLLKHAHPKKILITSFLEGNMLRFVISHDGQGISQQEFERLRYSSEGLGLKNIQNRIILLKGSIEFSRKSESEYEINLVIPVQS